ncbi:MAG: sigma-70 family RNA polymerase sigma factor [Caldimonas sp.]
MVSDAAAAQARDAESALLGRAMRGDAAAFGELVKRNQSNVRNQLRRLLRGDAALADDLAQDVFVLAWSRLAEFRRESRFSTWLYRIAYHLFLMHLRSAPPVAETLDDDAQPMAAVAGRDETSERGLRIDVERALGRLPEMQRLAIVHCFHLDLSHEEAAAVLGLPLGTLKSHVARAKGTLRDALGAWAPEPEVRT